MRRTSSPDRATGAIVIGGSTLLQAGGAAIALSTAKNTGSGYDHGDISLNNPTETKTGSKTLWREKGKGNGQIDVEVPGNRAGQIHYQEGHGKSKVKYIYKDG